MKSKQYPFNTIEQLGGGYPKGFPKTSQSFHRVSQRFIRICRRLSKGFPKTSQNFHTTQNFPKTSPRLPRVSPRLPQRFTEFPHSFQSGSQESVEDYQALSVFYTRKEMMLNENTMRLINDKIVDRIYKS